MSILTRAEERMCGETSQLALARRVMRSVLDRERSRAKKLKNVGSKQNFVTRTKVHCYWWIVEHFSLPFSSGHLYTIFKLCVVNSIIIVLQIKVNIFKINWISPKLVVVFAQATVINLKCSFVLIIKQLKAQFLLFKQIFYSSYIGVKIWFWTF